MNETTDWEQIETWKKELATAMADQQWQLALKFCSWLRYTLSLQERSDPEVEEAHQQAKEALARQIDRGKTLQGLEVERKGRYQQMRPSAMHQIISGDWVGAMDSIETLYQGEADRPEAIRLLKALKARTTTLLSPIYRQRDERSAALGKRFDVLVELVGGDPL
jgi:hypothetical protein